jgi:hypothetical protein
VPVLKNIRLDGKIIANHTFYRISPAINQRSQILDNSGRKGP